MSESFEKCMEKHHSEYDPNDYEYELAYKLYTAGLLRAAEIAMDGACKNTCSCPDCQPKHKIAAAIRKEAGE